MMRRIKTAVFPAAGMGSRFLPITKALPKETKKFIHIASKGKDTIVGASLD